MSAKPNQEAPRDPARENLALARLHHDVVKAKLETRIAELRSQGFNMGHTYVDTRPKKTKADRKKSVESVQIVTKVNNDWLTNRWST